MIPSSAIKFVDFSQEKISLFLPPPEVPILGIAPFLVFFNARGISLSLCPSIVFIHLLDPLLVEGNLSLAIRQVSLESPNLSVARPQSVFEVI